MSMTQNHEALKAEIRSLLQTGGDTDANLDQVLGRIMEIFNCPVGTIHALDPVTGCLKMRAWRGLPEAFLDKVRLIPIGKGMAGIAAERMLPVQVCNLQTDTSGVVKPGAKDTKMEGSLTAPMLTEGKLKGTVGVAKPISYEFSPQEENLLLELGAVIAGLVK